MSPEEKLIIWIEKSMELSDQEKIKLYKQLAGRKNKDGRSLENNRESTKL